MERPSLYVLMASQCVRECQNDCKVYCLVTKQRTGQVAATGPMPWIESNWAYDTLGRVTSQTVQKGANVGGAPEQVAQQVLAYLGNDDPASLVHTMGASGANANSKTFTFGYDWRHQLTSAVASQTARGAAPYVSAGTAFSGTYGYGNAGRLTKAPRSRTGFVMRRRESR